MRPYFFVLFLFTLQMTGAQQSEVISEQETADNSWWVPVKDFQAVNPGEHPRLLFRKSDLPELRAKARTPEGQAMIKHLERLLDGKSGDQMPPAYSDATGPYTLGKNKVYTLDTIGVYTFGHVAGYGLLYQLTGEKKYAELGRKCFELALNGQRDRDDRYSWVGPGGGLRAGPVLGWYAVGYDLCYDGWDEQTREKFGKAIEQYHDRNQNPNSKKAVSLEALTGGTMPPYSNHFGMQVGGAALALMAINGEPWVNQDRIDSLLKISESSMIRNVSEGFGDGGFYPEGDGTGSMSAFIAYLPAIPAWKNALGKDFVNTLHPNIQMTVLKWFYLTIVRDGQPDFWPKRGAYPHNVWDRKLSGGGYFGIGFGAVSDQHQSAMKWYYNHFMLPSDNKAGTPYEPSVYPQVLVSAFVNWPVDLPEQNPAEVLPLCYRDSVHSFYAWRNRWQDENDIVISVLTKPTRGYHGARADTTLYIAAFGEKTTWARVNGQVADWQSSENGICSVLTLEDGTSLAVDFSKASGADAMLVTTGAAEGEKIELASKVLTFLFLNQGSDPEPEVDKGKVIVGNQTISIKNEKIILSKVE